MSVSFTLLALGLSLTAEDIRALGESDDVRNVALLEESLATRLHALYTPDVEDELVQCLAAIWRLEPRLAPARAHDVIESVPASSPPYWTALRVLAGSGDTETIRTALRAYFDAPQEWGSVLAEAARLDRRFSDFRSGATLARGDEDRLLRSRLARNLGWVLEPGPSAAPLELDELGEGDPVSLATRLLALGPSERYRALRALTERDHRVLVGLPMDGASIDRLYPHLVRSQYPSVRARIARAHRRRGAALAALLLSPVATDDEKRAAIVAMRDAWRESLELPELYRKIESLIGLDALLEGADVTGLGHISVPDARLRLENVATPEAIAALMRRPDRVLSLPRLHALRRSADPSVSAAAEKALLALGAAGSSVFVAVSGASPIDLLPEVLAPPVDGGLALETVTAVASRPPPAPLSLVALFQLGERHPGRFLTYIDRDYDPLVERFHFVLSLSGDPKRVPLLIDLAVTESPETSRDAAFIGLTEVELGPFDKRLHRLAGHRDRRVRFQTAAALTRSGEPWVLRLLLAELDENDERERGLASSALSRVEPDRLRSLLTAMVRDGTARAFGVNHLLDLDLEANVATSPALAGTMWDVVRGGADRGEALSLLVASRLPDRRARLAVSNFLEAR